MTSELIIDVREKEISIALLEDKDLVEYQTEPRDASFSVGNIYLAKVKKIMPGLNASFVSVGYEREAFLHYLDLGLQYSSQEKWLKQVTSDRKNLFPFDNAKRLPDLPKEGTITSHLDVGKDILVQIVKEPISTKGPRITTEISFAGRYLVLIPFGDKVSVSGKIKNGKERTRLKQIAQNLKPKNCGIIVRTVAEGLRLEDIREDMNLLNERWLSVQRKVQTATERPRLVFEETSRAVAMLRDLFNPTYEGVYVNDRAVYEEVRAYVQQIAPDRVGIVKHYEGKVPIFDNFNVTKQIKSGFGKTVNYSHGAYLIIEHTEAMHVIDVNSGNRARGVNGQEANALDVNLGAADEIARQLRLRDIGGIIIIDFIDMNLAEDRQLLYERMCKNMQKDRARHNILPLSKFGLMQITRQRVRPAITVRVEEQCPTCGGKGTIKSSLLFTDTLEQKIAYLTRQVGERCFTLYVHPFVASYLNRGWWSLKRRWQLRYGSPFSFLFPSFDIVPSQDLAYLDYTFCDRHGNVIDMTQDTDGE